MGWVCPRNLLFLGFGEEKQIPRFARDDKRTFSAACEAVPHKDSAIANTLMPLLRRAKLRRAVRAPRRFDGHGAQAIGAIARGGRGCGRRLGREAVDLAHQQEYSKRHNQEIDDGVQE
jgi:hypothetical protein